jgi:hypothetical protein
MPPPARRLHSARRVTLSIGVNSRLRPRPRRKEHMTLPDYAMCLIHIVFSSMGNAERRGIARGASMLRRKILPVAMLAVLPAAALAVPFAKAIAEECRTKPGSSAAPGKHWYYRVNRSDHQHCWYLGSAQAEQSSHARRVISIVRRPLILHRATEQPDLDRQTTSHYAGSEEVAVQESLPRMNFVSRWDNWTPKGLAAHEVAATDYPDAYATTDADQKVQFIGPADDANSARPQYAFGKVAFAFLLLAGALILALPALAAALLKLARAPPASDSNGFTTPSNARCYRQPRHTDLSETASGRLLARTQTGPSVSRSRMPPDRSDALRADLQELMGALQRASAGPYTPRSFAPTARSRRSSGS